jgi:hypothetical protein
MKANENAAGAKKRSTKAFYPELAKGTGALDLLHLLQKAKPAAPQRQRSACSGKKPKLARFQNALKNLTHIPNKTSTTEPTGSPVLW